MRSRVCLQYIFSQHALGMRINMELYFNIHGDFWVVTISSSLFLVTS